MDELAERWAEIGRQIRAKRETSDESQRAFCTRIGVSANKFVEIRDGKPGNYRRETLVRISNGLWGRPDAIDRILQGQPPTEPIDELRDRLRRSAEYSSYERTDDEQAATVLALASHLGSVARGLSWDSLFVLAGAATWLRRWELEVGEGGPTNYEGLFDFIEHHLPTDLDDIKDAARVHVWAYIRGRDDDPSRLSLEEIARAERQGRPSPEPET